MSYVFDEERLMGREPLRVKGQRVLLEPRIVIDQP